MKCNIEAVHMPNLGEVDAWFHWNERMELTGYQNGLLINEGYPGVHITNGILTFNSNQGKNRQISIPLEFDIAGHLNHLGIDLN